MQECLCISGNFLCLYFVLILVAGRCNAIEMQECLCFVFLLFAGVFSVCILFGY